MRKSTKLIFVILGLALLVFNSCSGIIGGYDGLEVIIPGLDDSGARYLSSYANSGYIVLLDKENVFSANIIDGAPYSAWISGGVARISNIPAGEYVLVVILMDSNGTPNNLVDDTNYGLAIKEISIEKGFNSVNVNVGPGIAVLNINSQLFADFMNPSGYQVGFETDTIIFYTEELSGQIYLEFTEGLGSDISVEFASELTVNGTGPAAGTSLTIRRLAP